jgi:hypothetical protein
MRDLVLRVLEKALLSLSYSLYWIHFVGEHKFIFGKAERLFPPSHRLVVDFMLDLAGA